MTTGQVAHLQFNSLQAFWPGLQAQTGALVEAAATQRAFFGLWQRFHALPERYLLATASLHPTERYYPLRPELAESAYFLFQATRHPQYLDMGRDIFLALENRSRVAGGYASLRDVDNGNLDDHMASFFTAETIKYLYLLFDEDNFVHRRQYVLSTEGHLMPLSAALHAAFSQWVRFPGSACRGGVRGG